MGVVKIVEMLWWCYEVGIELVIVYLLFIENLQCDFDEFVVFIEIIIDVVEEICVLVNYWSVWMVGDLGLIGEELVWWLCGVVEFILEVVLFYVNVVVGYGGCCEIVDVVCVLLSKEFVNGVIVEEFVDVVIVEGILENLYILG